ncbi:ATP-grasp fold amidoligase family protein [Nesterenkonia rhizosphaerae]|uniref:Uncharacterized protein n=1 Tax=Nesterenkonia rhizosphaerae TaxID=1348272 RepID=A0ABP9FNW6_9MICC
MALESDEDYLDGPGGGAGELELVRAISSELPLLFMRIDMLRSHEGLDFGEFVPRPGPVSFFSAHWDRVMGEM